jgi:hypothetical protein
MKIHPLTSGSTILFCFLLIVPFLVSENASSQDINWTHFRGSKLNGITGKEIWAERVTTHYDSSPVYINGNIFFFSVKGEVLVLKAGRKYEPVAKSQMDSGIWATPAALRNSVILRTQKYIYRIGKS